MKKNQCCPSQLRYDVVSKDWVVIAPGRGKRPEEYKRQRKIIEMDLRQCPFCNLTEAADPLLAFSGGKIAAEKTLPGDWTLAVIPNKFPAAAMPANSAVIVPTFASTKASALNIPDRAPYF